MQDKSAVSVIFNNFNNSVPSFSILILIRNSDIREIILVTIIDRWAKLCEHTVTAGLRSFLRENALARYDESPHCIADIMHSVIIVDKWHPLLAGVYGNLKH